MRKWLSVDGYNALFNIRDFGAAGNAQSLDTAAIQRAVDACAASGGGVVYCPPGAYLTGTVFLKSHVELHLEAGATLLGSPARADYIRMFTSNAWANQFNFDQYLVCARRQQDVAISGRGTIDGNGRAFFGPMLPGHTKLSIPDWRPGPLVTFVECQDNATRPARIRNVSISRLNATLERGCYIGGGGRDMPIENVRLSDVVLRVRGELPADVPALAPDPYPQYDWDTPGLPHALFARHVRGLELRDVRVEWEAAAGPWQSAIRAEQCQDLELVGVTAGQAPGQPAAAVQFVDVAGASVRGCRAAPGTGAFLGVHGPQSAHIAAVANDLSRAQQAFRLSAGAPAQALQQIANLLAGSPDG